METGKRFHHRIVVFVLLALLPLSCSKGEDAVGIYLAEEDGMQTTVELKPSGEGLWSTEDEDLPFTWEQRNGQIWMHTKNGGVLIAAMQADGSFIVDLPGAGIFHFKPKFPKNTISN